MHDHGNRRSIRLQGFDYRNGGRYFVTICTKNRRCTLGDIRNGIMGLSDIGCVVAQYWQEIPRHFPGIECDIFVVMPNHIHGILYMDDPIRRGVAYDPDNGIRTGVAYDPDNGIRTGVAYDPDNGIRTGVACNAPTTGQLTGPMPGSFGTIIRSFKSACTKRIRTFDPAFAWQRNYYERIIRDHDEYARIYAYIIRNPQNWKKDDLCI